MTAATRDRHREPGDDELTDVAWNDRALFGTFRGLPWWAAVIATFVIAAIGTFIDVGSSKTVGWVFAVLFFLGAVGAAVFVERRSMFGPVVQPPLVLAIIVPIVVVLTQGLPKGGLTSVGLSLGKPLIDGFPAMALTTACTVLVGVYRVLRQKDPNRVTKAEVRASDATPSDEGREERPRRARPASADRPRRPASDRGADRPAQRRPRRED
ncbi:DUF6542 domain-containing protein [Actinosynnema sp. NPDC020468]|uniref:DUF6542 domain-containing protein n=1 Tax=Actinosynnema sp. NPDC020468 TaxID=3154488 RepID=UPI0033D6CFBA